MSLMLLLPSLIAGLAVSASDLGSRRVPLPWVCAGMASQMATLVAWCVWTHDWTPLMLGVALGMGSALAQMALAMVRPGSLGFGDVTATALMGLAVGTRGLMAVAAWWLIMGMGGLAALGVARLWEASRPGLSDHASGHAPDRAPGECEEAGGVDDRVHPAGSIPFAPVIVAAAVAAAALSP